MIDELEHPPIDPGDEPPTADEALACDAAAMFARIAPSGRVLASRITRNPAHGAVWRADYSSVEPDAGVSRFLYWRRADGGIGVLTCGHDEAEPLPRVSAAA
jgi:hypothetical protein